MRRKNKNNQVSHLYLMMNKPCGYVCSTVSDRSKVVYSLIPQEYRDYCLKNNLNLHTVGRLDKETCGLLLFTTDGNFSHNMTSPLLHVQKVYIAQINKKLSLKEQEEYKKLFTKGMLLPSEKKAPEQKANPAELEWLTADTAKLTIYEGKFHQVRRMFLAIGSEVVFLKRIQIGVYELPSDLQEGMVCDTIGSIL